MDDAFPQWSQLSTAAREAIEWAAACEVRSPDIGTRTILIGILRTAPRGTAARYFLEYFGLIESELYNALRRGSGGFKIDPTPLNKISLEDLPPLTGNAKSSLRRAYALSVQLGRPEIDLDCLFGGLLLSGGTARTAFGVFVDITLIDLIAEYYPSWLSQGSETFRTFFDRLSSAASQESRDASPQIADHAANDPVENNAAPPLVIANVRNDTDHSPDLIGVAGDARALAALLASKKLAPPLALGLYGDWGSGKTFFMRELEANIQELSQSDTVSYCSRIGQVWFNAWHYAEGNLWASLLDHVFTRLHGEQDAYQRAIAKAIETLSGARVLTEAANASLAAATNRVAIAEQENAAALKRRDSAMERATKLKSTDVWQTVRLTAQDQELVADAKEAAARLGVAESADTARDLWGLFAVEGVEVGASMAG